MDIDSFSYKFFEEYKTFLLEINEELAKKVWAKNSKIISSKKKTSSSSIEAYNFGIFSLNLINPDLEKIDNKEKIDFYSNIICDGKPDYSFDAIYIPEKGNIQIFDFKQGKQGLDFNEIELFKNYFIDHIENKKRTDPDNPILKSLLENLDKKITSENIECDIFIVREKEIDDYSIFENQLNELRWKTKKAKIGKINILDGKKINNLIKANLISLSDYNNSFYNLNFETFTHLNDGSNIITTSLFELLKFYLETKKLNYDIFKLNVRYDKGDKNIIRGKMIDTIEKSPDKFFRYHNGINLTYSYINKENNKLKIQYPQIINGCQTISLLEDKYLKYLKVYLNIGNNKSYNIEIQLEDVIKNIEKLKNAKILIKAHNNKLLDGEIDRIAEYSNNQNPIDKQNLRANDLIQIILEEFLDKIGYKYIRKEGEKKEGKLIEIDTLFQLIHTCIFQMPNWSKNNKNKIFTLDDSKNSYLDILNRINLEDIKLIADIYFEYLNFKELEYSKGVKISDYYDHHIVLSIYYIIVNEGKIDDDINKDFKIIFNFINNEIFKNKPNPGLRRHILQIGGTRVWEELKLIILRKYTLKIVKLIGKNEYNITELEKYKFERILEKRKNAGSKLGNSTSVIKKLVKKNEGIYKEDLLFIMREFYRFFWGNYVDKDRFIEKDIKPTLEKAFLVKEDQIYLKIINNA